MNIESIVGQNITIVFDALDLSTVNRDKLREYIDASNSPTIMDSPEVLVAVFPLDSGVIFLQFGDRRLRITAPTTVDHIGTFPIWTYASSVSNLIPEDKSAPIAYGFNYDVKLVLEDEVPSQVLNSLFFQDIDSVQVAVGGGQSMSIAPRLRYENDGLQYDLLLDPSEDRTVKVHLNIHRQLEVKELPGRPVMEKDYLRGFDYLETVLEGLFEL